MVKKRAEGEKTEGKKGENRGETEKNDGGGKEGEEREIKKAEKGQ